MKGKKSHPTEPQMKGNRESVGGGGIRRKCKQELVERATLDLFNVGRCLIQFCMQNDSYNCG